MRQQIVYKYKNNLYLNITNRCPVVCLYCIKYKWKMFFRGYNLGLKKEPSIKEVIKNLSKKLKEEKGIKEVVFCGYGEPLMRLNVVKKLSMWIKKNYPNIKVRVNTNGLAEAYNKINVCKKLNGLVDAISISLNAHSETVYRSLHKTKIKEPFKKIIDFIKKAKRYIPEVIITTICHPKIDVEKVRKIAKKIDVKFKRRKYFNDN